MLGILNRRKQKRRDTALWRAAVSGELEAVQAALAAGASPDAARNDGQTALMRAASEGDVAIVTALLQAGAQVDARSETGETALLLTIQPEFDASLGAAEADAHVRQEWAGQDPDTAVDHCLRAAAKLLLEAGATVDLGDQQGTTPLIKAVFEGRVDLVRLLLDAGANPHAENRHGATALLGACHAGHEELIGMLQAAGVEVDAGNANGVTGLMVAAGQGHLPTVKALLAAGARADRVDGEGRGALDLARTGEHEEVVGYLETVLAELPRDPSKASGE